MSDYKRFNFSSMKEIENEFKIYDIGFSKKVNIATQEAVLFGSALPNRFVALPMEGGDAINGTPSFYTFRKYERIAKGGYGLIWLEAVSVNFEGMSNDFQLCIREDNLDEFKRLVSVIQKAGRHSCYGKTPQVVLQLNHSGRYANHHFKPTPMIASHRPNLDEKRNISPKEPLFKDSDIASLIEDYVKAAKLGEKAGFDACDIKACHGYLLNDFMGAKTRPGLYGGSLENRTRLYFEIIDAIQKECPTLRLTTRLNISDLIKGGFGVASDGSIQYDEIEYVIRELEKRDINTISITLGNPYFVPHINKPQDLKGNDLLESPVLSCVRLLNVSTHLKKKFPSLQIISCGYSWMRQYGAFCGEWMLEHQKTDFIGFGRQILAYPDLPNDILHSDALDPKKSCTSCGGCSEMKSRIAFCGCIIRDPSIYRTRYQEMKKYE